MSFDRARGVRINAYHHVRTLGTRCTEKRNCLIPPAVKSIDCRFTCTKDHLQGIGNAGQVLMVRNVSIRFLPQQQVIPLVPRARRSLYALRTIGRRNPKTGLKHGAGGHAHRPHVGSVRVSAVPTPPRSDFLMNRRTPEIQSGDLGKASAAAYTSPTFPGLLRLFRPASFHCSISFSSSTSRLYPGRCMRINPSKPMNCCNSFTRTGPPALPATCVTYPRYCC
jgi:hypothetical protein